MNDALQPKYDLLPTGTFAHFYNDSMTDTNADIEQLFPSTDFDLVECFAFLEASSCNSTFDTNNLAHCNMAERKTRVQMTNDLHQFELLLAVLKIMDAQPDLERKTHPVRDIVRTYDNTEKREVRRPLLQKIEAESGVNNIHFNPIIISSQRDQCVSGKTLQELIDEYLERTADVKQIVLEKRKAYREHMQQYADVNHRLVTWTSSLRQLLQEKLNETKPGQE